ncbi:MAG: undecaprenyl-diphosphate phosphatase [Flavobacteriaceae bacterium]
MNGFTAFLLGVIQGLTEFLPVSSSGHLELIKTLSKSTLFPHESLMLTLVLHAATALSTMVVFREDIRTIVREILTFKINASFYFALYIVISMIPAAFVGLFLEEIIASLFNQNTLLVGVMLIITGGLLFLADRARTSEKNISATSAFLLGLVQAVAILPGISRSGATIATAVLLGIDKEKAARFSFLMVIPLILGSMAKSLMDPTLLVSSDKSTFLIIGFISAFVTGIIACQWMIRLVKKAQLKYFSYYCFLIGLIAITFA